MKEYFELVDVFAESPFTGNPLPVIFGADDLTTKQMQQIARWMNHSETAFLLDPTDAAADYRVRIFTLEREMPFAGHPTLGSCYTWLAAGNTPKGEKILQECGIGLVPVARHNGHLAFAAPPRIRSGAVDDKELREFLGILGIDRNQVLDAAWADNGPGWAALLLRSAADVLAIEPARYHAARVDIGVVGEYPSGSAEAFELRAFFSDQHGNIREDPVTGSLNASVGQWLVETNRAKTPYIASQGTRLGRAGRIRVSRDSQGTLWVGGNVITIASGQVSV